MLPLYFLIIWFVFLVNQSLFAKELESELLYLELANIATGHLQSKFEAPSTVTVITAEEIKDIGARTLLDVLRLVPGLILGLDISGAPIVSLRGVYSPGSKRVLFLLDGVPVNNPLTGGGTLFFADLSVDKIKRVEVIRGPGSVLYGSEAFTGVINIILKKDYADHLSYRRGTYDSDEVNLAFDKKYKDFSMWFDLVHRDKNSSKIPIKKDRFTYFPLLIVNKDLPRYHYTSDWQRREEIYGGLSWRNFSFDFFYINHADGIAYNLSGVPSDKSRFARQNFLANLKHKFSYHSINFEHLFHFSYYNQNLFDDFYPKGTRIFDLSQEYFFPYGLKWRRKVKVWRTRYEIKARYTWSKHRFLSGLVFQYDDLNDPKYYENILPGNCESCYINVPRLHDLSSIFKWISSQDRFYYSFYFQDEYKLNDKIFLTAGVRYDNYDDFGDNISSRLGIVLKFSRHWHLKFLYGEGFRAPSFRELYLKSCPVLPRSGNPSLDAEEMEAYEVGLFFNSLHFQFGFTYFYHDYDNLIYLVPDKYSNFRYENSDSSAHTQGVELESKFLWGKFNYLMLSYSYFDHSSDESFHCVPYHSFSLVFNQQLLSKFSFNYRLFYLSEWSSYHIDDYFLSDLTLRYLAPRFEFIFGVYNLWDKKYRYPDLSHFYPDNYVMPGRVVSVKLLWYF